jgi:protein-tyrosine-phosphatase
MAQGQPYPPAFGKMENGMIEKPRNVLFLCTGNSARSILAEAILHQEGEGRFAAFSAGSQPKGEPHPLALDLLRQLEHPVEGLRSKSWDEFAGADAPQMDFIITVCENAAGEACPVWPGKPATAHWGIPDPAAEGGTEDQRRRAFAQAYARMSARIVKFTALKLDGLDAGRLKKKLTEIGAMKDV